MRINFDADEDGEEIGPHTASKYCLMKLSVLLGDNIMEKVS